MQWRLLYNPLSVLGWRNGLAASTIVFTVLGFTAYWNGVWTFGALDCFTSSSTPSAQRIIVDSVVGWLSLGIVLCLLAKVFRSKVRLRDYIAACGLSRVSLIPVAAFCCKPSGGIIDIIQGVGLILGMIWFVSMLYVQHKELSRLSHLKAALSLVVGIALAELISRALG